MNGFQTLIHLTHIAIHNEVVAQQTQGPMDLETMTNFARHFTELRTLLDESLALGRITQNQFNDLIVQTIALEIQFDSLLPVLDPPVPTTGPQN